jgi:hypothetical protein
VCVCVYVWAPPHDPISLTLPFVRLVGLLVGCGAGWDVPAKTALGDMSVETAMHIHRTQPPGDILLFMTGQEEIDRVCKQLRASAAEYEAGARRTGSCRLPPPPPSSP